MFDEISPRTWSWIAFFFFLIVGLWLINEGAKGALYGGNLVGVIIAIVVLLLGFGFLRSAFQGTNPLAEYGGLGGFGKRPRPFRRNDYYYEDFYD